MVHEILFNEDRSAPFPVAAFNEDMNVATQQQQYLGAEIAAILKGARFVEFRSS